MCDASAAVALDEDLFAVGDDEDNALRVYSRHQPGPPLWSMDVSLFLGLRRGAEVDIEAYHSFQARNIRCYPVPIVLL
jgi:hypothetical protein